MILDVCCGSEKIYQGWQKNLPEQFVTMDIRKGDFSYRRETEWGHKKLFTNHELIVKPMIIADMRFLPFRDNSITAIICDPPHLKCGENSIMYIFYGSWSQEDAIRHLRFIDSEFNRVLGKDGFIFLKIMLDRKNIYLEMLKHFAFFLPIQLKRPRGAFKNPKAEVDGALWMMGIKRENEVKMELTYVPPEEVVNPFSVDAEVIGKSNSKP